MPIKLDSQCRVPLARESTNRITAAPSQLTEYSTRMWARRTETSTITASAMLNPEMTLRKRSIA